MARVDKVPRICHICSYYENILFDNLVSAQRSITEPTVFYFKPYGEEHYYNKDYIHEVNAFPIWTRLFFFLKEKYVSKAFEAFKKDRSFDIYFAHSLFVNGYIAYLQKKTKGTPYIVMVQNTDLNVFYKYRIYLRGIGTKILKEADKVIFASPSYREQLTNQYVNNKDKGTIDKKSVVIPYGIEDLFFESSKQSHAVGGSITVLSVGLICKNKNHLSLAKAIKALREKGMQINLVIVGKPQNRSIITQLEKYDFVTIRPYVEKKDLIKIYQDADIFALTSITETFGLVYAEALSQGLPIIYSKGQGFDGQFDDGYVGYAVRADDVGDIASGIEKAIANHEELRINASNAMNHFKWDTVTEKYKKVYHEIM